jgi:hypothetical protein
MALLQKIKTISRRLVQLEGGTGNNQPARASDVNPVIQWVNDRSDVTTVNNTVTTTGTTAQVGTLNAISGTITTATLTVTVGQKTTVTITDAYCTANSTVMAVITDANVGTGAVYIASVVPAAGSFVITLVNGIVLTGTPTAKIKFIIL